MASRQPYWKDRRTSKGQNVKSKKSGAQPKKNRPNESINNRYVVFKHFANKNNLAQGVAIHSRISTRTSSSFLTEVRDYTDANLDDRDAVVPLARKLRSREGICSSVADLLCDFAVTRGRFYSDNKELEKILNTWADEVNKAPLLNNKEVVFPIKGVRSLSRKIFDDYITDGDAVLSMYWENNVALNIDGQEQSFFLPSTARLLDTTILDIDTTLAQFGIERITLKLSDEIKDAILNPKTPADKFLSKRVPKEWKSALNKKEDIVLDPNVTYHLKRNGKDYKPWGESMFVKAFKAIADKRRLQAVDEATIEGLINRFTIFRIGLEDYTKNPAYHIPDTRRVQALIDIVSNPKRANAAVWPGPDLTILDIGPDGKILEFIDKYKQVDMDILRALHVSPLLIDGGSSGQAVRDWAAFISTEVGLDAIRNELEIVFTTIGKDIALANNIQYKSLYYRYDTQLLKDEKRVRNFAIKMFELGGISIETFVKTMGYDFEAEKELKTRESEEKLEEVFVNRTLPYQGGTEVEPEGRPSGTTNDDLGKDKSEKTNDMNNTAAYIKANKKEFYFNLAQTTFDRIKVDLNEKRKYSEDDLFLLELSIISGFSIMNTMFESEIKDVFYSIFGNSNEKEFLQIVLDWHQKHFDGFFSEMMSELKDSVGNYDRFNTILDSQGYRLRLYAQEIEHKTEIVSNAAKAVKSGFIYARWVTNPNERTCEFCLSNHDKRFLIKEVLDIFPPHPNCYCELAFEKE